MSLTRSSSGSRRTPSTTTATGTPGMRKKPRYMLVYSCILSYTHLLTYATKSPLGNIIYRRDKVQAHLGANNEPVIPFDPLVRSRSTGSAG
jgi:hypothetical protein